MRAPSKTKDTLSKVLPLRWSLGSKDRRKPDQVPPPVQDPAPVELVQYLESGRRPRCTKEPIVSLMSESRSKKQAGVGRAAGRSSSAGSLSCVGKSAEEQPYSQIPEGQRRASEKTASLKRNKGSQSKEENVAMIGTSSSSNTLTRRKDARKQSSSKSSQHTEAKPSSGTAIHPSYSTPSLQDGTLRRQKGDKADKDHHVATDESSKSKKEDVQKSHDGLFSFLRGNFLKKDKQQRKSKEGDSWKGTDEGGRRTLSKASLSNGAAGGRTAVDEGRSRRSGHQADGLVNGKLGRSAGDIKRSQSSSNIPTKAEQSIRRTASLHRNGMSTAPSRSLTAEKPSYGTLQRNRYSTTSLGRKRTVPESSF